MEPGTVLTKPLPEKKAKKDAKETPQMKAKREAAEKRLKEKREARADFAQKSKDVSPAEEPAADEASAKAAEPTEKADEPAAAVEASQAKSDAVEEPSAEREKEGKPEVVSGSADDDGEAEKKEKPKKEKAAVVEKDEQEKDKSKKKKRKGKKGSDDEDEEDGDDSVKEKEKKKKKGSDDDVDDDDDSSDEDENDWDSKKETNPAKDRFAKVVVGPLHPNAEEEHKTIAWWADKVQAVPFWKMSVEDFKKKYRVDVQPWSNNEGWDCEIVRRDTGNPAKIVDAVGKLMYTRLGKYGHCNRLKKYANVSGKNYAQPVGKAKYSFRKQLISRDPYIDALDPDMLDWAKWITGVGQWVIEQALSTKEFMAKLKDDVSDIILNAEKKKIKKAKKALKLAKKEPKLSQQAMTDLKNATIPMNRKQKKAAIVDYIWRKCCRTTVERQVNTHADGKPVVPGSENIQYEQKVWDKVPKRRKRVYKGEPQDDIQKEASEKKYQQYVIPTWTAKKGIFSPQPFGTVDLKDGDEVATACNFSIGVGGGVAKWDIALRIEPVDQIFIAHKEPRKVEASESYSSGAAAAAGGGGDDGSAEVAADGPAFQVGEEYVSVVSSTEEIVAQKKGKKGEKGDGRDSKKGKKGEDDEDESGHEATRKKAKKGEQKSEGESDGEEKEKSKKDNKRKRDSDSDDEKEKEKDKKEKKKKKQDSDSEGERQKEKEKKDKKKKRESDSDESEGDRKKKGKDKKQKKQKDSDDDAEMKDLVAGLSYQPATSGSKRGKMSREEANTGGKLKGSDDDKSDSDAKKSQKKKKRQG